MQKGHPFLVPKPSSKSRHFLKLFFLDVSLRHSFLSGHDITYHLYSHTGMQVPALWNVFKINNSMSDVHHHIMMSYSMQRFSCAVSVSDFHSRMCEFQQQERNAMVFVSICCKPKNGKKLEIIEDKIKFK